MYRMEPNVKQVSAGRDELRDALRRGERVVNKNGGSKRDKLAKVDVPWRTKSKNPLS